MAAHEEKISHNRRRLFKALSTAPVVATLSPGSALANNSGLQCLVNNPQPTLLQDSDPYPDCTADSCYVYQNLNCYDLINNRQDNEPSSSWPPELQALVQKSALEIYESLTVTGKYLLEDGSEFIEPSTVNLELDGTTLLFKEQNPQATDPLTYFSVPAVVRLALVLVEPIKNDGASETAVTAESLQATSVNILGNYPEVQPGATVQGIQATCLTSAIPGFTATTVARG